MLSGGTTAPTKWCWIAAIHDPFVTLIEKWRSVSLEILSLLYLVPSRYAGPREDKFSAFVVMNERFTSGSRRWICAYGVAAHAAPDMLSMSYCRSMRYSPALKM